MARSVHVQAARHADADQSRRFKVAVPPAVNGGPRHSAFRVRGQDTAALAAFLWVEKEVIRLRRAAELRERLEHVVLELDDDAAAQRDDPAFLPLSEYGDLPPGE